MVNTAGVGADLQVGEKVAADAPTGQHPLHRLLHNALRKPLHQCMHHSISRYRSITGQYKCDEVGSQKNLFAGLPKGIACSPEAPAQEQRMLYGPLHLGHLGGNTQLIPEAPCYTSMGFCNLTQSWRYLTSEFALSGCKKLWHTCVTDDM